MTGLDGPLERLGREAAGRMARLEAEAAAARWVRRLAAPLLAAATLDSLFPLPFSPRASLWVGCLAAAAVSAARAWRRRLPALALAELDARLGSKDLLATAHEFGRGDGRFGAILREKASALLPEVSVSALLPRRPYTRRDAFTLAAYAAAFMICLFPPLGPRLRDGTAYLAAAQAETARLASQEEALEKAGLLEDAKTLRRLREALNAGRLAREDALRALDAAEHGLKKLAEAPVSEASELARAGDALGSDEDSQLARAMRGGDAAEASRAARKLAEALGKQTPAENKGLASKLREAAAALSPQGPLSRAKAALEKAASALEEGNPSEAAAALASAAQAMEPTAGMAAARQAAEDAVRELRRAQARLGGAGESSEPAGASGMARVDEPRPGGTGQSAQEGKAGAGGSRETGEWREAQPSADAGQNDSDSERGAKGRLGELRRIQQFGSAQSLAVPGRVKGDEKLMESRQSSRGGHESTASVPYVDVLPQYAKAAEDAVAHEKVPAAYRQLVRDYFEVLQPAKGGGTHER